MRAESKQPQLLSLVPITVRAGKTFRGTQFFQRAHFDCSIQYALHCVQEGVADWNAELFAKRMAEDIKAEIRTRRTLMRCASFSELHDHCDANCLGGLCDDEHPVWLIDKTTDDVSGGRIVGSIDVVAQAQEVVDQWIKKGHPEE